MKAEVSRALGILVLIVGLVSSVISILVAPSNIQVISFALLLITTLVLAGWLIVRPILQKRKADRALAGVQGLVSETTDYIVEPANEQDIEWIAELEADVYSGIDAIPVQILKEWYKANPSGFFVIRMKNGPRIGHLDILPLRPDTMKQFLAGEIIERDIRGDCIYGVNEKDLIKDLYVESIIIRPLKGYSGAKAITCLLSNFVPIANNICNIQNIEYVYAVAASRAGAQLMTHLGFELQKGSDKRKDRHNLFVARFTTVATNVARICDERFKDRPMLDQMLKNQVKTGL